MRDRLGSRVHVHGREKIEVIQSLKHVEEHHPEQMHLYCRMGPLHRKVVSARGCYRWM